MIERKDGRAMGAQANQEIIADLVDMQLRLLIIGMIVVEVVFADLERDARHGQ